MTAVWAKVLGDIIPVRAHNFWDTGLSLIKLKANRPNENVNGREMIFLSYWQNRYTYKQNVQFTL